MKIKKGLVIITLFSGMLLVSGCTKSVKNEQITLKFNKSNVSGQFSGTLKDKLPDGEGKFISDDDWKYVGNFKGGNFKGKGTLKEYPLTIEFQKNKILGLYTGATIDGLPEGEGTFSSTDKTIKFDYSGEWEKGQISGKGKLNYDKYIVHFSEVDRTGVYDGETVNGEAEGEGTFSSKNSEDVAYTYTGKWKAGLFDGEGVEKFDSDEYCVCTGNFEKGDFKPNKLQWIKSKGDLKIMNFSVNDKSEKFITNHENVFPTKKESIAEKYVDSGIDYKKLIKSPDKYGNKFVKINSWKVCQIFQDEFWGRTTTTILVEDESFEKVYYIFYWGELKDIYENDTITCYGLPIDFSNYENVSGGTTNCMVMLGSYITKN